MAEPRRSGRNVNRKIENLTENDSGPNSPGVDLEDLSIEDVDKKKKSRALKTLKTKQDENSKFMSDFDPNTSRKAKLKVNDKTYKPPIGASKKSTIYDNKGILLGVRLITFFYVLIFLFSMVLIYAIA